MERNDIQGVERAPQSSADYLLRKGGKNVFGEANYRLVWAPTRMRMRGGRHQTWDAQLTTAERGGLVMLPSGVIVPSHHKPQDTFVGVKLVKKYGFGDGWVLERWVPSIYYGGVEAWNAAVVPGTAIPFGGPYPEFGDFEMCHYAATLQLPSLTELQNAIDRCEKSRTEHRSDVQQVIRERVAEDEWQYHEQMRKEREESEARMRDILAPLNSTSLQMGRFRTKQAEKIGIFTHVGN